MSKIVEYIKVGPTKLRLSGTSTRTSTGTNLSTSAPENASIV